jgi:hypothetical protein
MTEWLLLLVLVPAVVVPVVFLFGFAGCDKVLGLEEVNPSAPIVMITGATSTTITLTWMMDSSAKTITFERTPVDSLGNAVGPKVTTPAMDAALLAYEDPGLDPGQYYKYQAFFLQADGDKSDLSAPITGTTVTAVVVVAFDAVGTGNTGSGTSGSATTTWTHTASGDSRAVVVGLRWQHNGGPVSPPNKTPVRTVTYASTPMTSLDVIGLNNANLTDINGTYTYHEFFGLVNPPTGAQTVSLSVSREGAGPVSVDGCSVSYTGVSVFGSVSKDAGTNANTSLTQTVSSGVNEMVVQMFTTAGTITGYSQTERYRHAANGIGIVIGDAAGASSVPFTANRSGGGDYASLAVRLTPVT